MQADFFFFYSCTHLPYHSKYHLYSIGSFLPLLFACLFLTSGAFAQEDDHPALSSEDSLFLRLERLGVDEFPALKDSLKGEGRDNLTPYVDFYQYAQTLEEPALVHVVDSLFEIDEVPPALFHILRKRIAQISSEKKLNPGPTAEVVIDSVLIPAPDSTAPPPAKGFGFSSIELRPYQDNMAIELRVLGEVFPKFYYYAWNRTRVDYDKKASNFNIVDLYYNVYKGLFLVQETQFTDFDGAVPRYGAQYFHRFGNLSIVLLVTSNFVDYRNMEFLSQWRYFPPITPKLDGVFYIETLTIIDKTGHIGSGERVKLGLRRSGFQFGAAYDFEQIGPKLKPNTAPSVFMLKRF